MGARRRCAPAGARLLLAILLTGCTAPPTDTSATSAPPGNPYTGRCGATAPTLTQLAQPRGLSIGTAYRSSYAVGDPCYRDVALAEFDSLTTEIGTMMNTVQPVPGTFDFTEADAVADLAAATDKDFQLHALIWDPLDQPQWGIVPPAARALPPARRHRLMLDSITTVMKHYAGRAGMVTVVNEAFDQRGQLQHNAWWETTGSEQYLFDAFRAARLADPKALLFYNEHSIETRNDKSDAVYDLVKRLHDTTIDIVVDGRVAHRPLIDGVGFQAHMLGGRNQQPDIADVEANLQRFADLGLQLRFTELDVRIPVLNGRAAVADLDRQRLVYDTMTRICLGQPACTGLTLWGFTDKRPWIADYPESFSGYGAATPLDSDYRRKPAWAGIADALT